MSEWTYLPGYNDPWQSYAHLPIHWMTAAEVMAIATPGSGLDWDEELRDLWSPEMRSDTLLVLTDVHESHFQHPIIIGPDGRLWDGHHRLAAALALGITVPARIVPVSTERDGSASGARRRAETRARA